MNRKHTKGWAAFAIAAAASVALTGCVTSGSGGNANVDESTVSTAVPDDDITLTVSYVDPPTEALAKGFESEHPNVTIKTTQVPFGDYIKSIKRAMASDDPPDIAEYNPGAMRTLIPAGLTLNLDPYAQAYGWDDSFPQGSLEALTASDDAKQFNTGHLYATPGAMSLLGVFANESLLTKAGIDDDPKTVDEFADDLAALKSAGIQPLSLGGLEVGGFQLWNALSNVLGDVQGYKDWVYGADDATIQTDGAKKAAQYIVDWAKAGYFPAGASSVSDSDALANFTSGGSAFLITGNWNVSKVEKALGDDAEFFIMPGTSADAPPVAAGSSVAYSISSKTEHPNAAAAFLNYMSTAKAAPAEADSGFLAVDSSADVDYSDLGDDVADAFADVAAGAGVVSFADYASPGMIDKLEAGVQGLITGHMAPDAFLKSLQTEWSSYHE